MVDKETYEASLYQNTDYAKKWYKKLNEMYHKGLISAETFTQDYDAYLQKISQGRVLGMFDQDWNFQDGVNVLLQEEKYEEPTFRYQSHLKDIPILIWILQYL